mgnify:CR=1 FL=1
MQVMRPKSEKQFKSWSNYSHHPKLRKVLALNSNRLIEIMAMVKVDQHQATIIKDSVESEIAVVIKLMMQMMKMLLCLVRRCSLVQCLRHPLLTLRLSALSLKLIRRGPTLPHHIVNNELCQ